MAKAEAEKMFRERMREEKRRKIHAERELLEYKRHRKIKLAIKL